MTEDIENPAVPGPFRVDVVGDMTIEWDVPIPTSDGIVLRADVFRPSAPGAYPVVLSCGPYGKGRPFQQALPPAWQKMVADHPDILEGSSGNYHAFEAADPEKWVPDGYVCVRIDSRGTGRSPGYLDPFTERETRDLYEGIEWAAEQPWSNGRIGLNGISYLAINQWQVAALQPPHLAAICVWEGAGDIYRDAVYHGGILSTFVDRWYSLIPQYGTGESGGLNPHTGQPVCGDETFTEEELGARRADFGQIVRRHPLLDAYHRARISPDWSRIEVPVLSAGNWGGMGLHLRGNTLGFEQAASDRKWLTMHEDTHFSLFYAQYGLDLQKRFFGHFLKDEDTGWTKQPRVELRTRHADGRIGLRSAEQWPLPGTRWTRLYLDATDASMGPDPAASAAQADYSAGDGRIGFSYRCTHRTEIAGPLAAKLYIDSSTADADLFLVLRAFSPDGTEVVFQGTNDPVVPVAQGWLRASHRALDADRSRPFLPVHLHDRTQPLTLGRVYELDVEILPTSLVLPAGYTLTLDVQGHDHIHPGTAADGSGSFLHNDPGSRPADLYGGTVTLHTGDTRGSYLLLPIVSSH
jgi:predicted acyl esterase